MFPSIKDLDNNDVLKVKDGTSEQMARGFKEATFAVEMNEELIWNGELIEHRRDSEDNNQDGRNALDMLKVSIIKDNVHTM